jgi:hypothetical protein
LLALSLQVGESAGEALKKLEQNRGNILSFLIDSRSDVFKASS